MSYPKLLLATLTLSVTATSQAPRKLFLVAKTYTEGSATAYGSHSTATASEQSYSPKIVLEFNKKCPSASFTSDQSAAEFVLDPQPQGSVLRDAKGDVVYISPARKLGNMVKDICKYLSDHPATK